MNLMAASAIPFPVQFDAALKSGKLDEARAILDEFAQEAGTGGPYLPECYAELAGSFDRRGEHDSAITANGAAGAALAAPCSWRHDGLGRAGCESCCARDAGTRH
jgi:hypothetical protein